MNTPPETPPPHPPRLNPEIVFLWVFVILEAIGIAYFIATY
jgi:hypothetical protein